MRYSEGDMAEKTKSSLDQHLSKEGENSSYRAKPTLVSISEKYELPEQGSEHTNFEDIKKLLRGSDAFTEDDIANFKNNKDVRYFLADLDTGEFSKERVNEIIKRYKNNPEFRKEFFSLLKE